VEKFSAEEKSADLGKFKHSEEQSIESEMDSDNETATKSSSGLTIIVENSKELKAGLPESKHR
jgi:hypothetical protein